MASYYIIAHFAASSEESAESFYTINQAEQHARDYYPGAFCVIWRDVGDGGFNHAVKSFTAPEHAA